MRRLLRADAEVVEQAPAKLNLDLILTGRRPDGYHELDSVVAFADIGDGLTFRAADDLRVECQGPFANYLPDGDANIVGRAARLLAAAAGVAPQALIRLSKRLPVASGIGGGSTDAAAALRGLARLWHLPSDSPLLAQTALALGSDVLACVGGRSVRMRGAGEVVEPLPRLPPFPIVLLNPSQPLATATVFAQVQPELFGRRAEPIPPVPDLEWLQRSRNDLEEPAQSLLPIIARLLVALAALPGCRLARMSGSGPTCFGLFDEAAGAKAAAAALAAAYPDWWVAAGTVGAAAV